MLHLCFYMLVYAYIFLEGYTLNCGDASREEHWEITVFFSSRKHEKTIFPNLPSIRDLRMGMWAEVCHFSSKAIVPVKIFSPLP